MSVHRDRDGYRVRWREHGKQQSRNFPRRAEAIAFDAEVKRRGRLGTLAALTAPAVTLDAFVEHTWAPTYAAMLAPRTQRGYGCLYDTVISPTNRADRAHGHHTRIDQPMAGRRGSRRPRSRADPQGVDVARRDPPTRRRRAPS